MEDNSEFLLGAKVLGYSVNSKEFEVNDLETKEKVPIIRHYLDTSQASPIGIRIESLKNPPFAQSIWGHIRTSSWAFDGDRSDLHDLISSIVAITLRKFDISTSLLTVSHQDMGLTKMPAEIYSKMLSFERHGLSYFEADDDYSSSIRKIIMGSYFAAFLMDNVFMYTSQHSIAWKGYTDEARKIAKFLDKKYISGKHNFMYRKDPDWGWFRSFKSGISIFTLGENILDNFKKSFQETDSIKKLKGVTREIFKTTSLNHAVSLKKLELGYSVLEFLKDDFKNPEIIPIENQVFMLGKKHIISLDDDCGDEGYRNELQLIKLRNDEEREILFPNSHYVWNESIDADRFEKMSRDLLELETNVRRVRRVSVVNEGDGGRDLEAEWLFVNKNPASPDDPPYILKTILVQCKAYKKSVNKQKASDIRDTIDMHNADGYHLIVSSQLTTQLFDYLSSLRKKGIQIDWWTRDDLEIRLRKHPDIAERFPDIIKPT